MKTNFHWKRVGFALISFILLILFDQWTKSLAVANLMNQEPFVIVKDVFQLRYLENRGAAFGMMQGQQTFFVISALIAVAVITYVYFKLPWEKRFHPLRAVVLFIAAGAVGNLIDRLVLGYVVDFFYFELIDFPIFNVADIYVTCATIILALLILFYYKEDELDCLFPKKKEKN
ncbi:MAG: signal peptidase II [Lachnospiraceae bacterium]|nr:signal peptidase II [Lachnospiraceae bacterium]